MQKKRALVTTIVFILIFTIAMPVLSGEVAGVTMAERTTIGEKNLVLNGMGLRKKLMFKVYVAGLYLEARSSNASTVVSSDQTKRVDMVMIRDLDKEKITEAVEEGFEKNNKASMPALRERLDRFNAGIADLKEGDHLTITYDPGVGTTLEGKGGSSLVIEGKDFADALFSVWFGTYPVDEKLKSGMLGS